MSQTHWKVRPVNAFDISLDIIVLFRYSQDKTLFYFEFYYIIDSDEQCYSLYRQSQLLQGICGQFKELNQYKVLSIKWLEHLLVIMLIMLMIRKMKVRSCESHLSFSILWLRNANSTINILLLLLTNFPQTTHYQHWE